MPLPETACLRNPARQALILAAGLGSRLSAASRATPKCLLDIGGRPLLEHQVRALRHVGVEEFFVVIGAGADLVKPYIDRWPDVNYVENKAFAETNSLYSVWLARGLLNESFILANCDVLAHPDLYRIVAGMDRTGLTFDSSSDLSGEEMRVSIGPANRLNAISKDLPLKSSKGENVGILKIASSDNAAYFGCVDQLISDGHTRAWSPKALHELASRIPVHCKDIKGIPWTEIDFAGDLHHARSVVWRQIEAAMLVLETRKSSATVRAAESKTPRQTDVSLRSVSIALGGN